eukprot:403332309
MFGLCVTMLVMFLQEILQIHDQKEVLILWKWLFQAVHIMLLYVIPLAFVRNLLTQPKAKKFKNKAVVLLWMHNTLEQIASFKKKQQKIMFQISQLKSRKPEAVNQNRGYFTKWFGSSSVSEDDNKIEQKINQMSDEIEDIRREIKMLETLQKSYTNETMEYMKWIQASNHRKTQEDEFYWNIIIQYSTLLFIGIQIGQNIQSFMRNLLVSLKNIMKDYSIKLSYNSTILIFAFRTILEST